MLMDLDLMVRNSSGNSRVNNLLAIAQAEVGYKEHPQNFTKYGAWMGVNGQPWCATFVSWVAARAGCRDIIPQTSSVLVGINWFKKRRQWGKKPRLGAIVYFWFLGKTSPTHVGIVISVNNNGTITTIEGNASDQVVKRVESIKEPTIYGYGYPRY